MKAKQSLPVAAGFLFALVCTMLIAAPSAVNASDFCDAYIDPAGFADFCYNYYWDAGFNDWAGTYSCDCTGTCHQEGSITAYKQGYCQPC